MMPFRKVPYSIGLLVFADPVLCSDFLVCCASYEEVFVGDCIKKLTFSLLGDYSVVSPCPSTACYGFATPISF